ncbi:TPA: metalloregulator ArsR/SmtB family transcription factor [Enterobacter hormaechei]|uniref:ArsR/SmtB family transcription factor n=1 Tax=Enterobacteriaceae TaxID=543 RepID=UPI001CFEFB87|nr:MULTISPECIES: metalloregulator ArsR/SmtB family transcription factor [Enterobacteriaceae]HCB3607886.1 helix-turn-helix transcriptional regulator [Klebsiella aerogenes]EKL1159362.1 helix-turn-helix transcriptional regulator [Klebsiella pneumoniae]MCM7487434.1 metalloregulator ArsR/SmtB family transcription factor [Enterobacter kobei]UDC33441.1 metalloregulator ArsR/SmtB family transcription factor [Klebsiella pneumoniae]HCM7362456.1 helix-turn-helix transcriptional regulator [Klebsiella aero
MKPDLKAVSLFFHALSDEGRMRLVMLLEGGEKSVTELSELSGEKIVNVSAKLRDLLYHRLVVRRREGRKMMYSLADNHVADIIRNACEHISEDH